MLFNKYADFPIQPPSMASYRMYFFAMYENNCKKKFTLALLSFFDRRSANLPNLS